MPRAAVRGGIFPGTCAPLWLVVPALVGVLLGVGSGGSLSAQEPPDDDRVTITGRVLDASTRAPLEGVTVEIAALGLDLRTDSAGHFEIRRIPRGTYELALSHEGYQGASGNFAVVRSGSFVTTLNPLAVGEDPSTGRVVGRVVDGESGSPLVEAQVSLPDLSLGGVTSEDGRFRIARVPPGRHRVEFSYIGYATVRDTITVVAERTSDARVRLSVDPVAMEPMEVTVERREFALETAGFYERRDEGWGQFIDLEAIERQEPREMTDLFDGMAGVTLLQDRFNPLNRYVVLRGGRRGHNGGPCYPKVWMDGTRFHRDNSRPANLDQVVDPTNLAGIEVYPSQAGVPLRYGGPDSTCGVILIWTRQVRGS